MNIPHHLSHKPIIAVDYAAKDSYAGDAKFLSLGKATWADDNKDYSAKVFRLSNEGEENERWSRQSEELPFWRVLDLATLLIACIRHKKSSLLEECVAQNNEDMEELVAFLKENYDEYVPRLMELKRLLTEEPENETSRQKPNIFSFASSELSQDAIFAWILSWADPSMKDQDPSLHNISVRLLQKLLGVDSNFTIERINTGCQWQNIDIWVEINDDLFLIIEDKTNTTIHDDQLQRYREFAKDYYKEKRQIFGAYVKTGNETKKTIDLIKNYNYIVLERRDVLECIKDYSGNSDLVKSFISHLSGIEMDTNSFTEKPFQEWSWNAWQGFYKELENRLIIDDWSYVSNPAGGFLGIWWHWVDFDDEEYGHIRMYLQIEQPQKLCVKIEHLGERELHAPVRDKYHQILFKRATELGININDPVRFGNGTYMTIGIIDLNEILGFGIINIEQTIDKLHSYERLVSACKEAYK